MPEESLLEDRYLGDGVYASFDGYCVSLDLRAQDPTGPITRIVLEPPVFQALLRYRADALRRLKELEEAETAEAGGVKC